MTVIKVRLHLFASSATANSCSRSLERSKKDREIIRGDGATAGNICGSADKSLQLGILSNKTCPSTDILPGDVAITDKRE